MLVLILCFGVWSLDQLSIEIKHCTYYIMIQEIFTFIVKRFSQKSVNGLEQVKIVVTARIVQEKNVDSLFYYQSLLSN